MKQWKSFVYDEVTGVIAKNQDGIPVMMPRLPFLVSADHGYHIGGVCGKDIPQAQSKLIGLIQPPALDLSTLHAMSPAPRCQWLVNIGDLLVSRRYCLKDGEIVSLAEALQGGATPISDSALAAVANVIVTTSTDGKVQDIAERMIGRIEPLITGHITADVMIQVTDMIVKAAQRPAIFFAKTKWTQRSWNDAVEVAVRRLLCDMASPVTTVTADEAQRALTDAVRAWDIAWMEGDGCLVRAEAMLHEAVAQSASPGRFAGILASIIYNGKTAKATRQFVDIFFENLTVEQGEQTIQLFKNNSHLFVGLREDAYIERFCQVCSKACETFSRKD